MLNMVKMEIEIGLLIKSFRLQSKLQHLWEKSNQGGIFKKCNPARLGFSISVLMALEQGLWAKFTAGMSGL